MLPFSGIMAKKKATRNMEFIQNEADGLSCTEQGPLVVDFRAPTEGACARDASWLAGCRWYLSLLKVHVPAAGQCSLPYGGTLACRRTGTQSRGAPAQSSAALHGANMRGTAPLQPLLQIKQLRVLSKGSGTRARIFLRARADGARPQPHCRKEPGQRRMHCRTIWRALFRRRPTRLHTRWLCRAGHWRSASNPT